MSSQAGIGDLVQKIREASTNLSDAETRNGQRFQSIEASVNELLKRTGRPGASFDDYDTDERKSAIGLCRIHKSLVAEGDATAADYMPGATEIQTAMRARQGLKALMRTGNIDRIEPEFRKSLSAFSFGNNGFLLAPEMSNRVLSCLIEPSDFSGLCDSITISGPSIRFLIDNATMVAANWACESNCWHNNPAPDLHEGLGELDLKPETLRYVVCATSDLLSDASFNVEQWLLEKVSRGFRAAINASILLGDGAGKPLGLLSANSGIPVCEVSPATAIGQFNWQDLISLKYEIPLSWQDGSAFFMNQRTFGLLQTMSSGDGRPLFGAQGTTNPGTGGFSFAGSPIHIISQMPDVAPGATPILFGNLKAAYLIVWRKAITMLTDPYTAGWCTLFKFECRVGGSVLCPNAMRLLKIA